MPYGIIPFAGWAGYQPDQGFYVQQPATVGQLNRLRAYVEYLRRSINEWAAQVDMHEDQVQELDDRLARAEDMLKAHDGEISANKSDISNLAALVNNTVNTVNNLIGLGVVHGVQFTPTDHGWRTTVSGQPEGTQHEVSIEGDDSLPMVIEHSSGVTRIRASVKGGSQDLSRLGYSVDENGIVLSVTGRSIHALQVYSSDGTVNPTYGANNETAFINLAAGKSLTDYKAQNDARHAAAEQQTSKLTERIKKQEQRGTFKDISAASNANGWNVKVATADTNGASTGDHTAKLNLLGDETISVTPNNEEPTLMLHAADQLQRLPVLLADVRLAAADGHIQLIQSGYDPKTGRTVDPQTVGNVGVSGSDTVTVSTTGDGLHVDATPAVSQAKEYTDQQIAALQATLSQLQAKVDGQTQTISNLQTQVAQYKDVADRSVTSASLDVAPADNGDPAAFMLRFSLFSKNGASVAVLPAEIRFISERNTLDTGVQLNGHTATIELDTK